MNQNEEEGEDVYSIDDPNLPDEIRQHAMQFRTAVRFVGFFGPDIVLLAEDGDVIDICSFK